MPDNSTYKFHFDAVKASGQSIAKVPSHLIDYAMCVTACSHRNESGFAHVPKEHRTDELIEFALWNFGTNLQFLDPSERTYARCLIAVLQDTAAYAYVPQEHRTVHIEYINALGAGCSELGAGWIYAQVERSHDTLRNCEVLDDIYDRLISMHLRYGDASIEAMSKEGETTAERPCASS